MKGSEAKFDWYFLCTTLNGWIAFTWITFLWKVESCRSSFSRLMLKPARKSPLSKHE